MRTVSIGVREVVKKLPRLAASVCLTHADHHLFPGVEKNELVLCRGDTISEASIFNQVRRAFALARNLSISVQSNTIFIYSLQNTWHAEDFMKMKKMMIMKQCPNVNIPAETQQHRPLPCHIDACVREQPSVHYISN